MISAEFIEPVAVVQKHFNSVVGKVPIGQISRVGGSLKTFYRKSPNVLKFDLLLLESFLEQNAPVLFCNIEQMKESQ